MDNFRRIFDNPTFVIVCALVLISPLMRGSVHLWSETLIQMLVMTGVFALVLENVFSGKDAARPDNGGGPRRPGLPARKLFLWGVVPCTLLGVWAMIFSRQTALAVEGLVMLLTYLGFFFMVFASVRGRREQRILVWMITCTALLLCIIGLLKRFDLVVFPWWDYTGEFGEKKGAFSLDGVYVNRNHMAGFLEMAIPMFLGIFLMRSWRPEIRTGMIVLVIFFIVCQALTLSRGGWTSTLGALFFMMTVLLLKKDFKQKGLLVSIFAGSVVVVMIILVSTPVVQRITTLTQRDIEDNLTGRLTYWEGTQNMIKDNLYTGTGPGTFTEAFPAWQAPGFSVLPVYAHNDYLQFMADNGIFFIPLTLWLLFLFFRAGFQKLRSRSRQTMGISLGGMAAVVAILIHSFSDFNLHIPANILLFTTITALVLKPE